MDEDLEKLLLQLGEELDNEGWRPNEPMAIPFETPWHDVLILRAQRYLDEVEPIIRPHLCDGRELKRSIDHGADIVTTITAMLAVSLTPAATVAAILCKLGLKNFCAIGPRSYV